MGSLLIKNARSYDRPEAADSSWVLPPGGIIEDTGEGTPPGRADRVLDAHGRILSPGFLDVHVQGAGGSDVLDATPEALETISRTCARFGVTGFLATTVYRPGQENPHLRVAAASVDRDLGGAALLGVHLEGPFISQQKRGMIQPDCIGESTEETLDRIVALLGPTLTMMTMAPELPGSEGIVSTLVKQGAVPALGHTMATYEATVRGFDLGIGHVTHLFNAMPGLHHREPGPLAAIFERPEVTCQVITDGVHIHPSVVRLAWHALGPERFVTITDGMHAMGLPDGRYTYSGLEYEARNGTARYHDGTLIGTALGLNQMVARLRVFTGCSLSAAMQTVTQNPARVLGMQDRKGTLQAGHDADLVILNDDLSVHATIVSGRIVYQR
jgi:N-acetylglucosamine-6-phosphate deacetylase